MIDVPFGNDPAALDMAACNGIMRIKLMSIVTRIILSTEEMKYLVKEITWVCPRV